MADYPPTPPYGLAPSQAAPPYREVSHREIYDNGDTGQPERDSPFEKEKAQAREAFAQNAKAPIFSAASVASGIPPLPIYGDHGSVPYGYQSESPRYERSLERTRSRPTYKSPPGSSHLSPIPPKKEPTFSKLRASITQNVEEGELSEGEFEETPPIEYRNAGPTRRRNDHHNRQRDDLQPSTRQGAFNTTNEESEGTSVAPLTDMYGRSIDLNRHRSESYSPYDPPNEMEYEPHLTQEVFVPRHQQSYLDEYEPPEEFPQVQRVRQSEYQSESSRFGSLDFPDQGYLVQKPLPLGVETRSYSDVSLLNTTIKSVHDARKEAQNAILNLLPLKVRYHDYVEEGIDELVVRRQFESLGFPLAANDVLPNKPYGENMLSNSLKETHIIRQLSSEVASTPQALQANRVHDAVLYENLASSDQPSSLVTNNSVQNPDKLDPVESRKDRIARLLAEKKRKLPPPIMQSNSPVSLESPEAAHSNKTTTNSHLAAKADKERLLRQKMEALQKSREQRAQKAAAKIGLTATSTETNIVDSSAQKRETQSIPGIQEPSRSLLGTSSSPVQVVGKPSIPGLFLASGPTAPQPQANRAIPHNSVQVGGQRKRPVASDFDKPTLTASPSRRPFGQNNNEQPLVIDVSDDDTDTSNHSDMEVDDQHLANSGGVLFQGSAGMARTKAIRDLPPLSDFPPRKSFPTPSSTMSTPLAAQPLKSSVSKPEDLHRKELEIQEMKKRIAEAERRKRAKQNSSGSQTPKPNDTVGNSSVTNGTSLADKIDASLQIEHLIDDASRQVDQDQLKLAETHVEEQATAEELKRREAERKRLRRAEIASNLPVVDAEVEKAQKQLADLRAEIARIEFAVQRGMDDKRKLAEEMEKLSQEADEQLQLQKDALSRLDLEEIKVDEVSGHTDESYVIASNVPSPVQERMEATMSDAQPMVNLDSHQQEEKTAPKDTLTASASTFYPISRDISIRPLELPLKSPTQNISEQSAASLLEEYLPKITPDQALEIALQHATAQINVQSDPRSDGDVEMTDLFAADPENLEPVLSEDVTENSQQDENAVESGEDLVNVADGESDPYEPPEATPSPVDMTSSIADSPPFSPAPPRATPGSSRTDKQNDNISMNSDEMTTSKTVFDNDLALTQANQDGRTLAGRKTFFTPYESPLKSFRAFRFHPSFQQEVRGGFKSITYSNNIIEGKELCRYELAGGVCNDSSCEFQHFRDMGLADDAILVELGNSAGYSEEDKPRKTKDFHVIASEIAAYRARFLGDNSKILLLEDQSN